MHNPERIFTTLNAYQSSQLLKAAINLDVFTAIDNGARTVSTIAESCDASPRGIRILADYLVILQFLKKDGNTYALTDESKFFLSQKSPAYLGIVTQFLNSEELMKGFNNLEDVVRRGTTLLDGDGTVDYDNPIWIDFAKAMAPMMQPAAMGMAKLLKAEKDAPIKVLDVAAGHGVFGIEIAKEYPNATIAALDWPNVLKVAVENSTKAGIFDRYKLLPGSAFEVELTEEYDVILLTNFLHHFDVPTCETLLKRFHPALKDEGQVLTLEFVPNDDRVSPPAEAAFSLVMLASTPAGDAYTFSEIKKMFGAAGFTKHEIHTLPGSPQHLIVSGK